MGCGSSQDGDANADLNVQEGSIAGSRRTTASPMRTNENLPAVFATTIIDKAFISVREFGAVQAAVSEFSQAKRFDESNRERGTARSGSGTGRQSGRLSDASLTAAESPYAAAEAFGASLRSSPGENNGETDDIVPLPRLSLQEAAPLLLQIGAARVADLRPFQFATCNNTPNRQIATAVLLRGCPNRPAVSSADVPGSSLKRVASAIEASVQVPLDAFVGVLHAADLPALDAPQDAAALMQRAYDAAKQAMRSGSVDANGPAGTWFAVVDGSKRSRAKQPEDKMAKAVQLGVRLLYAAVGGATSMVACLGDKGLPQIPALTRMFRMLHALVFLDEAQFARSRLDSDRQSGGSDAFEATASAPRVSLESLQMQLRRALGCLPPFLLLCRFLGFISERPPGTGRGPNDPPGDARAFAQTLEGLPFHLMSVKAKGIVLRVQWLLGQEPLIKPKGADRPTVARTLALQESPSWAAGDNVAWWLVAHNLCPKNAFEFSTVHRHRPPMPAHLGYRYLPDMPPTDFVAKCCEALQSPACAPIDIRELFSHIEYGMLPDDDPRCRVLDPQRRLWQLKLFGYKQKGERAHLRPGMLDALCDPGDLVQLGNSDDGGRVTFEVVALEDKLAEAARDSDKQRKSAAGGATGGMPDLPIPGAAPPSPEHAHVATMLLCRRKRIRGVGTAHVYHGGTNPSVPMDDRRSSFVTDSDGDAMSLSVSNWGDHDWRGSANGTGRRHSSADGESAPASAISTFRSQPATSRLKPYMSPLVDGFRPNDLPMERTALSPTPLSPPMGLGRRNSDRSHGSAGGVRAASPSVARPDPGITLAEPTPPASPIYMMHSPSSFRIASPGAPSPTHDRGAPWSPNSAARRGKKFEFTDNKAVVLVRFGRPLFVSGNTDETDHTVIFAPRLPDADDTILAPALAAQRNRFESESSDEDLNSELGNVRVGRSATADSPLSIFGRLRRGELRLLQRFYSVGWLIAYGVAHGVKLPLALPVTLFRILKSFVPTGTPDIVCPLDYEGGKQRVAERGAPVAAARSNARNQPRRRSSMNDLRAAADSEAADGRGRKGGAPRPLVHAGVVVECVFHPAPIDFAEVAPERLHRSASLANADWDDLVRELYALGIETDCTDRDQLALLILAEGTLMGTSFRPYIRAIYLGLLDSGVLSCTAWTQSTPAELRTLVVAMPSDFADQH